MRTMGWARRYEGAELGEVPGWYDHRDREDDRPSPLMVQRKEGNQQCNHMHQSPSQMVVDFTAMGVFHGVLFHWKLI